MRVAHAAANAGLASSIADNLPSWPITTLASRAVAAALDDRQYALRTSAENLTRRNMLRHDLERIGLTVYPAAANSLLIKLPITIDPHSLWENMIVNQQVVLRSCANYEALAPRYFRVAVRSKPENRCLVSALADEIAAIVQQRDVAAKSPLRAMRLSIRNLKKALKTKAPNPSLKCFAGSIWTTGSSLVNQWILMSAYTPM